MAPFAGWSMPIRYGAISEEHACVREKVGLFDVSHMGEIRLVGPGAMDAANKLFTNDVRRGLPSEEGALHRALYGAVCKPDGGILDDVIAYAQSAEDVLFCVNASNVEKIDTWFRAQCGDEVEIINESLETAQIAVQGPKALALVRRVLDGIPDKAPPMRFMSAQFQGTEVTFATTGYTGERGGEIFVPNDAALALWEELIAQGQDLGVAPIGLGARDTLRLQKGFCLYGNDIDESTTPIEAGLSWTVRFDKGDFNGRDILLRQKEEGYEQQLVPILMQDRGIPRHGYPLRTDAGEGRITSGTMIPGTRAAIAMAYVPVGANEGSKVEVEIHRSWRQGVLTKLPFS
jgi:aminomethyltransferase